MVHKMEHIIYVFCVKGSSTSAIIVSYRRKLINAVKFSFTSRSSLNYPSHDVKKRFVCFRKKSESLDHAGDNMQVKKKRIVVIATK